MDETLMEKYFPKLVLNIPESSVTCTPCYVLLKCHLTFITSCLHIEREIREHYKVSGSNGSGHVELYSLNKVKAQHYYQAESDSAKVEIKHEYFMGIKEQVLDIDQKTVKEENSDRYQDAKQYFGKRIQCNSIDTEITEEISQIIPYKYEEDAFQSCMLHEKNNSEVLLCNSETCQYQAPWRSGPSMHMLHHKSNSKVTHQNGPQDYTLAHKSSLKLPLHKCDTCAYQTKDKSNLRRHMLTHKDTSEVSLFKCAICSFQTKYKCNLPRHMLIHKGASEVPLYKCEICTYQAKLKNNVQSHKLTHKDDSEVQFYKCKMCTYKTKHKGSLKTHMLIHRNASEIHLYKCGMCTFKTKYKCNLPQHMLIHKSTSEVPLYKCEICVYETKFKNRLRSHKKLTHKDDSEVSLYKCKMCARKTKCKSSFKNQVVIHRNVSEVR